MQQSTLTWVLIAIVLSLIVCSLPGTLVEGMDDAGCNVGMETTQRSMTNAARLDTMKETLVNVQKGVEKVGKLENTVGAIQRDVSGLNDAVMALKASVQEVQELGPPEGDVRSEILG